MKEKEIPFGAKDSELIEDTYFIPEGMEAVIDGNKVVIRRKESEDEKIKKAIIDFFSEPGRKEYILKGFTVDDILAWLEKQSEQKPTSVLDIDKMVNDFAHKEVKGYGKPSMIEIDAYRKGINDALRSTLDLEKQGERKPTSNIRYEVGDGGSLSVINEKPFDYENANIQQKDFAPKVEPKFHEGDWITIKQ